MHNFIAAAAFAAGASAGVLTRQQPGCCFQLTASGGKSGTLWQLGDGQNRIGGSGSAATYCINNGGITDSQGRGCILTPPTTQFQCDSGASPTMGFSIGSGGSVSYSGNTKFYACPASETEWNVYTQPVSGQKKCVQITLSTGGKCSAGATGSVKASASSAKPSKATASSTPSAPGSSKPPVTITNAPAPSTSIYACNPAHSYPDGAQCISTAGSLTLVTPSVSASSSGFACNPAHSYPNGASCISTAGSLTLVTPSAAPSVTTVCASASGYSSQPTSSSPKTAPVTITQPVQSAPTSAPASSSMPASSKPASSKIPSSKQASSKPVSSKPVSSKPVSSKPVSSKPAPSSTQPAKGSASACQTSLTGAYQTPHLIVPVSSSQPSKAYGTQYNAAVNSDKSTIFNFDIPSSYKGMTCSVIFLFPKLTDLQTSSYTFSGSGSISFDQLSGAATQQTTYDSCPSVQSNMGTVSPQPGNSYVVASQSCAAGQVQAIKMSAMGGLSLEYFEDWNPAPLGLYITAC